MQQKSQQQAVYSRGSQYRRFAKWERYPFGSLGAEAAQLAFAEESRWMPKQFQQQQSENRALATPAHEWVYVPQHSRVIRMASQSSQRKKKRSRFYTSSRMGSWPANK